MKKYYAIPMLLLLFICQCSRDQNKLKIGVIGAETGDCSADGKLQRQGIQLAVDEINKEKLLKNGDTIEIKYYDSKSEAKSAVTVLNESISIDNRKLFIGDVASGLTKALIPIINDKHVFLFSPWAGAASLKNCCELFSRNYPSGTCEAKFAAKYIIDSLKLKNIAIISVNNEWGINLKNDFVLETNNLKGNLVFNESCSEKDVDFRTLISKLKNTNAEVIYLAGYQEDMGHFTKQLREQNVNTQIIANTSFLNQSCLNIAQNTSEGVLIPTPDYNPQQSKIESIENFRKKYRLRFTDKEPTFLEANAYDAVMLIKEAYNKVGSDPISIAKYIRNLQNYTGAAGIYSFVNGDVDVNIVLKKIVNGKPVLISKE